MIANDGGAFIVAGNEKVLAVRLSDARFFYETDLKVSLEKQDNFEVLEVKIELPDAAR